MTYDPSEYVQKVRDETRSYIQDLLGENQRLRGLLTVSDGDVEPFREETLRLEEELKALRDEVRHHREERLALDQQLKEIEAENHQFSSKYVEVEERNNNLANLYVASYRLHETLDRNAVLEAILEIIINLVGSEEFVIFERRPDAIEVELAASFGVEEDKLAEIDPTRGQIAATLKSGTSFFAEPGAADELVGCVPLRLGSDVVGAVAILSLLEHKDSLEPIDHELFDLLSAHAATALYLSGMRVGA